MYPKISRRQLLLASLALGLPGTLLAASEKTLIEVWKSPYCGCCKDWISYLEGNGFTVRTHEVQDLDAARRRLGMPEQFASCHTAKLGDYLIEGHVPAKEIQRLLKEKPAALGIAVPGMPVGSPGMDGPAYGGRRDPFDVLLVLRDGRAKVFSSYR